MVKKVFRGTLDFKLGSTQSVGKEEESVLLLSETVKSDSIPALMCSEDDVIGEHGASIGQLDEEQLFYLMSRGIEEHQAKLLVIASALKTWMEDIEDDQFREKVLTALDGSIEHAL
jgi:Fe-S cluster assembly scaffold protein SufB